MKHKIHLTIYLLLIWQLLAVAIHNDIIIPYPLVTLKRMFEMLLMPDFYQTLLMTLSHVIIVVLVSVIMAFGLAYVAYRFSIIEIYVSACFIYFTSST